MNDYCACNDTAGEGYASTERYKKATLNPEIPLTAQIRIRHQMVKLHSLTHRMRRVETVKLSGA